MTVVQLWLCLVERVYLFSLDVQQYLQEKTGQHDFPNIFINEQHIGGYNDLENLSRTEELPKLLNKS